MVRGACQCQCDGDDVVMIVLVGGGHMYILKRGRSRERGEPHRGGQAREAKHPHVWGARGKNKQEKEVPKASRWANEKAIIGF